MDIIIMNHQLVSLVMVITIACLPTPLLGCRPHYFPWGSMEFCSSIVFEEAKRTLDILCVCQHIINHPSYTILSLILSLIPCCLLISSLVILPLPVYYVSRHQYH